MPRQTPVTTRPDNANMGLEATPTDPLQAGIDALRSRLADIPDVDLGPELVRIRGTIDRLESVFAEGLRRFDSHDGFASAGALSAVSWLRWQCRLSPWAATEHLAVARQLGSLPQTEAAFARGDIGYSHAAVIARTADDIGDEQAQKREVDFLASAKELDPGRFWKAARELRYMLDAAGALNDANRAHKRRSLWVRETFDGFYLVDGRLDAEGGAIVQTALNALSAPAANDCRSACQRRADALVELARRQLDSGGLPEVAGQRPHLTVTASMETLMAIPGHQAGALGRGDVVPSETVRRLACDAALTRVLLSSDGQPLDVGRTTRTAPPALRRALVTRDRGCRFPSCDRPSDWTDCHHLKHWADGGETNLANVILLCRRHHRKVHEEGWRLAWSEDAGVVAIPPPRQIAA